MTPLPLTGRVETRGLSAISTRTLLRLANPEAPPKSVYDAALLRTPNDYSVALSAGYGQAVSVMNPSDVVGTFDRVALFGPKFRWLGNGDLLAIEPALGRYRVLWRTASRHNAFLVTDRCDHLCLMCSQPPKDVDDSWIIDEIGDCLSLLPAHTQTVGFTGGEPFLDWQRFIPLVDKAQQMLPSASAHVLTNGRAFSRAEVVTAWSALDRSRASVGIPIYSAVDAIHNHIVQSQNALDETVLGILRLKDRGNRVEVRIVLHQLTVPRLVETCAWLARNLPFLDHVALMGMEDTGFALANHNVLWADPVDYAQTLASAVAILAGTRIRLSVYNLPLCVLPDSVRPFAVQSISDWKNAHHDLCAPCDERGQCAGFFTSGKTKLSRGLSPIVRSGAGS